MSKSKYSKLKLTGNCKVCQLVHAAPDLWTKLHDKVLKDGLSQRSVVRWVNSQLEVINVTREANGEEPIEMFNAQNFSTHFQNHMESADAMTLALRNKALGKRALDLHVPDAYTEEDISVVESYIKEYEEFTDYTNLSKMIETLESLLMAHNAKYQERIEASDGQPVSLVQLNQFKDMIDSVSDLKMRLSKLKNSSSIAGAAIQKAVAMSVKAFINLLVTATTDANNSFQEVFPEGVQATADILNKMREDMAQGMKQVLEEVVDEVFTEYKIK